MLSDWAAAFPLDPGTSQTTVCEAGGGAGIPLNNVTYCDSTVSPKEYTQA